MTNKSKDDCYIDLNPIKLNLNLQKAKLLLNKSEHLEGVDKKDKRKAVLRIGIRKILASWIRIRIQGVKYQPKTAKKNFFTPKTQLWTFEKKIKISSILNGSSSKDTNKRKKF